MSKASHTGLTHPLVVAYLDDLDRALATADAQERLDTITAVTEHLRDALDGTSEPTTVQVRAVLDDLGSAEKIAAAATPASTPGASASDITKPSRGDWVPPVLLGISIASLVLPFVGGLLALGTLAAAIVLLKRETHRRGMLKATIAVSAVTLVVTAALVAGALAYSTTTATSESPSDVTVLHSVPAEATSAP